MPFSPEYRSQVELLLRALPALAATPCFALKGGTAINLFHQNLPRLSVDIDLTYLPIEDRQTSMAGINAGLSSLTDALTRTIPGVEVSAMGTANAPKLQVRLNNVSIKVEPSTIMRGTLEAPEEKTLAPRGESEFGISTSALCVSTRDLYAGKLCAALDRQHPRDLFDVMLYMDGQSLDDIRGAFVCYLCCHNRPMHELLAPNEQPIDALFATHFAGMTNPETSIDALKVTQANLFGWVCEALTDSDRAFLISVKSGSPDYSLCPYPVLEQLPGFQWKLQNIGRMSARNHKAALDKLRTTLGVT